MIIVFIFKIFWFVWEDGGMDKVCYISVIICVGYVKFFYLRNIYLGYIMDWVRVAVVYFYCVFFCCWF